MGLYGSIFGKTRVQFIQNNNTVIQIDASISETHSRESPSTEFPVENGTSISDHTLIKPFKLEIQGMISDTPIGGVQGLITEAATTATAALLPPVGTVVLGGAFALFSALSKSKSPSVAAYGQLLQLQASAQPFDVLTSLYRYENMWINSISVPRNAQDGNALMFTISLAQLLIVKPQSVDVKIFANPGLSANQTDAGEQGLDPASAFKRGDDKATSLLQTTGGKLPVGGT